MAYDYDFFVIGGGSAGVRCARISATHGARVAVAEERFWGGTCVNVGCVPKKLMVQAAEYGMWAEDSAHFGWSLENHGHDWAKLAQARDAEVARLSSIYGKLLAGAGVTTFEQRARLIDAHTIEVGDQRVTAERILVATGGRPSLPELPGIEYAITSNQALDLMQLPERMVIVGAGYIAVEFAGIFNALGVKVTLVLRGDTVLRGFDQDVRVALHEEMVKKGVELRCETVVRSIEKTKTGYSLRLSGDETIETDLVMYATGRSPNTDGLGLDAVGVTMTPAGAVVVDEFSRTNVPSIFAVGDVTDRMNLTPVALGEARALINTLYLDKPTAMDYADIPTAVFSMPPIGTVGLTEAQARAKCGCGIDVYLSRFKPMRNTLAGRDERTMMKMIVDRATDKVLGIHVVGPDAAEMVQGFGVAMKCGVTKAQMDSTVGIHPTAAEELVTMRDKRPDPSPECEE
ncbi:MAG: glutathione-disulfide reductase [Rhodospirillaceae bacterium]|nr:glutathione-disulfide reductase [Rhodospirillales bacterium]